ncbi:unnamed protein product [Gordionus sp. m RMFG-2023]
MIFQYGKSDDDFYQRCSMNKDGLFFNCVRSDRTKGVNCNVRKSSGNNTIQGFPTMQEALKATIKELSFTYGKIYLLHWSTIAKKN